MDEQEPVALTVIVPFYDCEPWAAETLRSLRRAARPGIEFVLVEDGSRDGTLGVLEAGVADVPGARLVVHPANRGASAARNTGLDHARGRYVAFLDGDDFVLPDYYEDLLGWIRRLEVDFVRTDHVQVFGRRREVHRIPFGPRGVRADPRTGILPTRTMTSIDIPNVWCGIYDRLALGDALRFDEELTTCNDRPQMWRVYLAAGSFAVLGLTGVFYRREVAGSLTATIAERNLRFVDAYELILAGVAADRDAFRFLPKAHQSYLAVACHHLRRGYPAGVRDELVRSLRVSFGPWWHEGLGAAAARLDPARRELLHANGVWL
ncbi:MAG: glycosyltransferase family 2 protein [Propionicimonas sp.]|nr:glycosyltransferase family 2 protein [Propionicimonas sp.]